MSSNNNNSEICSSTVSDNIGLMKYVDKNGDLVEMVRNDFLQCHRMDSTLFYEQDIEMVKRDVWWTVRFLRANGQNREKALQQMVETFQWRKSFGILDRDQTDLPIEFINGAGIFLLGKDFKGRSVIYFRLKVHHKVPELDLYIRQFMAGALQRIEHISGSQGFVIVYDCSGVGISNIDLSLFRFFSQLLQQYYPCGVRQILICNMPKICRPILNASKSFIGYSAKEFHFCSKKELKDYIPSENIPRYLGGESDFDFTKNIEGLDTSGCKTVNELGPKYGFSQEQIDRFIKIFEPSLKEAQLLIKGIPVDNEEDENGAEDDDKSV